MQFIRTARHHYDDPLSRVWIVAAERIGFRVARTPDAYASTDGRGTILVGTDETLDADDCLAQMIFHEMCHALVEGDEGLTKVDWGLDNTSDRHTWREHACLRLQAHLAGQVGLRDFFAPTTDYRVTFWDSLSADPFAAPAGAGGRREPSCVAARLAAWRASRAPWAPHLAEALTASAAIAAAVPRATRADLDALRGGGDATPSLWTTVVDAPPAHPAGHAPVATHHGSHGCADCAWSYVDRKVRRCRHAASVRLPDAAPACTRWEPAAELDCLTCGACCREAYHSVEISSREPVIKRHPAMVVVHDTYLELRRDGERCAALGGGRAPTEPYGCTIYPDRPRTCREFTLGSANCLDARRRVGLSL